MKQRIKKLCAMLIAGTMLFSMVGCSGTESKENTKGKTQKEENTDKALYISVEKESTSSDKVEFPWYTYLGKYNEFSNFIRSHYKLLVDVGYSSCTSYNFCFIC